MNYDKCDLVCHVPCDYVHAAGPGECEGEDTGAGSARQAHHGAADRPGTVPRHAAPARHSARQTPQGTDRGACCLV